MFDLLGVTAGLDEAQAARLREGWASRWRAELPRSDPERAAALVVPVAALYSAAVCATFVANIEPSEHRYHADDVPAALDRAAALARATPMDAG